MEALPAYNPHLLADVGALFIATGALMLMAAFWLERRLVLAALVTWLLFAVPHVTYHLGNLGPYDTADTIGNVVTLSLTVIVPVVLLGVLLRPAKARRGVRGA